MKRIIKILVRELITLLIAIFLIMLIGFVAHEGAKLSYEEPSLPVDVLEHYREVNQITYY